MRDIQTPFTELIAWLPATEACKLLPGLSPQTIATVEAALQEVSPGARLPSPLKRLYAICGGQEATAYEHFLFAAVPLSFTLLPVRTALAVYRELHTMYEQHMRPTESPHRRSPWFDPHYFPFGWSPGESGCLRCMQLDTEKIYFFDDDGGLQPSPEYDDLLAVFREAVRIHRQERTR